MSNTTSRSKNRIRFFPYQGTIVLCLLIWSSANRSESQPADSFPSFLSVERLTTDDGLASNQIRVIHRSQSGFMWFLTDRGLIRYDGYEAINYQYNPNDNNSLSNNELTSILEDGDGILWIGSKEGFNRFDPKTGLFKRYFHDPNKPASINDNFVTHILKDKKGRYWIATHCGLNLFDPVRETFRSFHRDPNNPDSLGMEHINRLAEDLSGKLWLGPLGNASIERFDPDSFVIQRYKNLLIEPANYPDVITFAVDPSGSVLFGSWAWGLFQVNPADGSFKNFRCNPSDPRSLSGDIVHSIIPDGKGRYWIGTRGGGLCRFDPQTGRFQRIKVVWKTDPNAVIETIFCIYQDNAGILWLGTMNDGVCRYDSNREQFLCIKNNPKNPTSLSENRVYAICASRDGTIWIGTDGGGLNQYDPKTNSMVAHYVNDPSRADSLASNTVISLYEDSKGTLYVGCWQTQEGAFSRFLPETKTFRRYPHNPGHPDGLHCITARALRGDSFGKIWIGGDGSGICIFDPNNETFQRCVKDTSSARGLRDRNIRCFYEDHSQTMWVGTESAGLLRYDRSQDRFVEYRDASLNLNRLSTANIMTIYEDRQNALWLGTENGIVRLSPDRTQSTNFSMSDGLADSVVKGILEDDYGFLWISMDNGKMSRFHPETRQIRNFDRSDGLQGLAFNSNCFAKGLNGEFYFGGIGGVNCIWPDRITQNANIPPIALIAFNVLGKSHPFEPFLSAGQPIRLDYRQNYLSFEFAALNYTHSHKNQYAYRLTPLETDWNVSGVRRYAQYTALEPGDYIFQAKGSNNDGEWNEKGISLSISIKSPYWRTWWFKTGSAAFILATLFLGYRYRVRFLEKQRIFLEMEVEKRTRELNEANRALERLSKQDGLTKLANRRCFDEHIEMEWRRSLRNRTPISLIFIDVDFFKPYNDFYGHQAGDECLQRIAEAIRGFVNRPGDLVARYGGEEFMMVLTDAEPAIAYQIAEQLRLQVESLTMPHHQSNAAPIVTISLGVASMIPRPEESPDRLIQAADQALYQSKQKGRNIATAACIN
ncbi:MAG: diguanylate cyclase [Candidatus Omnitrophota bacterium]